MNQIRTNKQRLILALIYMVSFFLLSISIDCISAPEEVPLSQKLLSFYSVWLIGRLSTFKVF